MSKTTQRSLNEIAREIRSDWSKQPKGIYFGAKPYLDAMSSLNSPQDQYGMDSGKTIILYFLSNASTYRGTKAKELKSELKQMVK